MILLRLILPLLLLFISTVTTAAEEKPERWYQIELILFKQPQPAVESSEEWNGWGADRTPINYAESIEISYPKQKPIAISDPSAISDNREKIRGVEQNTNGINVAENLNRTGLQAAAEAPRPIIELQPFTFVPVDQLELGDVFERLNGAEQYQILIHTAWVQPGLAKEKAVSIHIHDHMMVADKLTTDKGVVATDAPTTTAASYPLDAGSLDKPGFFEQSYSRELSAEEYQESLEPKQTTFNGTIKVILARYLHVDLNLDYAPQGFETGNSISEITRQGRNVSGSSLSSMVNQDNLTSSFYETPNLQQRMLENSEQKLVVYHMHESRRMRSKVLHYLDHPKIGVLIKILPVEMPQKDIQNNSIES